MYTSPLMLADLPFITGKRHHNGLRDLSPSTSMQQSSHPNRLHHLLLEDGFTYMELKLDRTERKATWNVFNKTKRII